MALFCLVEMTRHCASSPNTRHGEIWGHLSRLDVDRQAHTPKTAIAVTRKMLRTTSIIRYLTLGRIHHV
jgi:hypothetical protein